MPNINFVPDDYVQSNESRRANLMCLVLFSVVMAGLGGSFATIKVRQGAYKDREKLVNDKIARLQESIRKFEDLQAKRKDMMRTALTTAELLEPVPRSVLLASLTNNLPPGVSLLKLELVQKEPKVTSSNAATSRYKTAQAESDESSPSNVPQEKLLETHIDIGGMAPSDLEVAEYMKRLSTSSLLTQVALVESKEYKVEDTSFREFKLKAQLARDVHLTKDDVDRIRARAEKSVHQF